MILDHSVRYPINVAITRILIAWTISNSLVLAETERPNTAMERPNTETERTTTAIEYGDPERVCDLQFETVKESSGLASSRLRDDVLWTHNDSGGKPQLFAFDLTGNLLGAFTVTGASARDWEDMASFELEGQPYLLVGDVGDNGRKRTEYQFYLVREPSTYEGDKASRTLAPEQTIRFRYERGPKDCESIAFDPTTQQILMVTKNWKLTAEVYALDWPTTITDSIGGDNLMLNNDGPTPNDNGPAVPLTATFLGKINVPGATALDVSPDGARAVVLCYGNAYEYVRAPEETWKTAFGRKAREIKMPPRKQGETLCFGRDGRTLFLTSEHLPTPLFRVAPIRVAPIRVPKESK